MRVLIIAFLSIGLTGCAGFKNQYQCKPSKGVPCKSITEISQMIDNNALPGMSVTESKVKPAPVEVKQNTQHWPKHKNHQIIRVPEETMSVYIAGFEDEEGIYHHGHDLHVVTQDAFWKTQVKGEINA